MHKRTHTESQSSLDKIRKNLASISPEEYETKQNIVLVSTGSNLHLYISHVKVTIQFITCIYECSILRKVSIVAYLLIWLDCLEQNYGFRVVGGFISPSHDSYVKSKLGKDWISSEHRNMLCKLGIQESLWVDISTWESEQNQFEDFPTVVAEI